MDEIAVILITLLDTGLLIAYIWSLYPFRFSAKWKKDFIFLIILFSISAASNRQELYIKECVKYLYLGVVSVTFFKGRRSNILWEYLKIATVFWGISWACIIWPAGLNIVQDNLVLQRTAIGICAGFHIIITAAYLIYEGG